MARGGDRSPARCCVKILLDMNLSPAWGSCLKAAGFEVSHWSEIGPPAAPDTEIMAWASAHHAIVFTHDLDFGILLALTQAGGPSVIQVRTQDVSPARLAPAVIRLLREHAAFLHAGALITLDESKCRVRILPIQRPDADSSR